MESLQKFITFLSENYQELTLLVTVILGISTLVLSIINLKLLQRQNVIHEKQVTLESDRDQPRFRIKLKQERDINGEYGTDILTVANIGNYTLEPCDIKAFLCIQLRKYENSKEYTLFALIGDYFFLQYRENNGDEEVCCFRAENGNSKFYDIYMGAIHDNDKSQNKNLVYYFIDKIVLVKIDYTDIHKKKHEIYYRYSNEIDKTEFDKIYAEGNTHLFNLSDISYKTLKELLDQKIEKGAVNK